MLIVDRKLDQPLPEFKGKRCFILGSGPSLDSLDLSLLKGQLVFALNAAITLMPDAYWVVRDLRAIAQILPRLRETKNLRVVTTIKGYDAIQTKGLARRRSLRVWTYNEQSVVHEHTVAEDALQLARRAGCSDAVLVGVDCKAPPGRPYAEALSWKPCAWYEKPVPESKKCASFLRALKALASGGRLAGFPVVSTSASCDAFPYLEYTNAVSGGVAHAV